ncbi:MAG: hypothetical protein RSG77_21550 [Hafnia sp.]
MRPLKSSLRIVSAMCLVMAAGSALADPVVLSALRHEIKYISSKKSGVEGMSPEQIEMAKRFGTYEDIKNSVSIEQDVVWVGIVVTQDKGQCTETTTSIAKDYPGTGKPDLDEVSKVIPCPQQTPGSTGQQQTPGSTGQQQTPGSTGQIALTKSGQGVLAVTVDVMVGGKVVEKLSGEALAGNPIPLARAYEHDGEENTAFVLVRPSITDDGKIHLAVVATHSAYAMLDSRTVTTQKIIGSGEEIMLPFEQSRKGPNAGDYAFKISAKIKS